MANEMEFSSAADLTPRAARTGIVFANTETGQEAFIEVVDKYPQLEGVHIEGRRVIEVSVEHYVELAAAAGWHPVAPATNEYVAPADPVVDPEEGDEF